MKSHTETEENYLKGILHHAQPDKPVSTNTLARELGTSPASVTDMLKKLSSKRPAPLVNYTPYRGATLTEEGRIAALRIVRKHRLWEVFLVDILNFSWDNVHAVAEQLEHVESPELIRAIDKFLGYPKFDPHGDPIPAEDGTIVARDTSPLSAISPGKTVRIAGVKRSEPDFLQYLDAVGLTLDTDITVVARLAFDQSMQIEVEEKGLTLSGKVVDNLLVLTPEAIQE